MTMKTNDYQVYAHPCWDVGPRADADKPETALGNLAVFMFWAAAAVAVAAVAILMI